MEGIYPYSFLLDIMCESGLRLILVNKKRYKGEYMATIKDVAKQAGVSVTTVSIIINGKAEERKISAATQERVAEASWVRLSAKLKRKTSALPGK